jgi:aspartate/glutamate racemase
MRTLGLLTSLGEPTHEFFLQQLESEVQRRAGDQYSASVIALGFNQGTQLVADEKYWTFVQHLRRYIRELAEGGAEAFMLAPLEWNRFAPELTSDSPIPLLHPVDALARELQYRKTPAGPVGLIASWLAAYPGPFVAHLSASTGRPVIVPRADPSGESQDDELVLPSALPATSEQLWRLIEELQNTGATAIVFGTPEVAELLRPSEFTPAFFHLPAIQAAAVASWMLPRSPHALS